MRLFIAIAISSIAGRAAKRNIALLLVDWFSCGRSYTGDRNVFVLLCMTRVQDDIEEQFLRKAVGVERPA